MKSIAIVIPFYNEEENLKVLIPEIIKSVKSVKNKIELLLVDDQSTDNGYKFCKNFKTKKIKLKIFKLKKRGKQTRATRKGFEKVRSDYIIHMDADLQDDPKYLPIFINKINQNYDLILGHRQYDRVPSNTNIFLKFASRVYDFIIESMFKKNLSTYRSSYAAYNFHYLKNIKMKNNDHRYLTLIAISNGAKKCTTFKVWMRKRIFGKSNYNTLLKIIPGFIEAIILLFKIKLGYYK